MVRRRFRVGSSGARGLDFFYFVFFFWSPGRRRHAFEEPSEESEWLSAGQRRPDADGGLDNPCSMNQPRQRTPQGPKPRFYSSLRGNISPRAATPAHALCTQRPQNGDMWKISLFPKSNTLESF